MDRGVPTEPEADAGPVSVVYLAGMGRSGSTLLDRMLDQLPGWWSVGEVVHLWERGVIDDERCGCGEPFSTCAVWQRIGQEAFGGWDRLDVEAVVELRESVERDRFIPQLLRPGLQAGFAERLRRWQAVLARLYRGASRATGARVIVDSSKHVSTALGLRHNPWVDLTLVHLVRDSRGVAYSWTKPVARPATDGTTMMTQWSPLKSSLRYVSYNTVLAAAFGADRVALRYEDMVTDPDATVATVRVTALGSAAGDQPPVDLVDDDGEIHLGISHGISGNPMRQQTGFIRLRLDEQWRHRLPDCSRRLVTAVTLPTLVTQGYPLRPGVGASDETTP